MSKWFETGDGRLFNLHHIRSAHMQDNGLLLVWRYEGTLLLDAAEADRFRAQVLGKGADGPQSAGVTIRALQSTVNAVSAERDVLRDGVNAALACLHENMSHGAIGALRKALELLSGTSEVSP